MMRSRLKRSVNHNGTLHRWSRQTPARADVSIRVLNTFLDDGGLPEVVTQDHIAKDTGYYDAPIPVNPDPTPMTQLYETTATVTPLHLLGDQSDTVDCPFCRHRVETRVKKNPSMRTQ
jgi:hypothetical protein